MRETFYIANTENVNEILNEIILTTGGKLMFNYAESYKRDPGAFISTFLKFNSFRMACCLVVFTARKHGLLDELKGRKDFSGWVEKQRIEERWKPVLSNLLLIIYGVVNENI
jgi:hypothetical protein